MNIDWALISSVVLCSSASAYLAARYAQRSPREYLQSAMRIRRIDESACGDDLDGICFPRERTFAVRSTAANQDYLYFHEVAHQALADRGLQGPEATEETEAAADVVAWLLCRRSGASEALRFSSSVSQTPWETLLSLQEIAAVFQVADHLFAILCDGGLKPPQPTKWSQQNVCV